MDQAETIEDEVLDAQVDGETPPQEPAEPEEVVVSIEGETPPQDGDDFQGQPAPEWVKELRKTSREQAKKIRELEAEKLSTVRPVQADPLGPEPTLEGSDYDEGKFKAALSTWYGKKSEHDAKERDKQAEAKKAQDDWQAKLAAYRSAPLNVSDFDDAEHAAIEVLNQTQQGVLLIGPDTPQAAKVLIYALGKNPKKLKELAAITDPVKFAFAAAKLESQLKVTPRKAPPAPEITVRGSASVSGAVDSTLARLEAEADKTGDRSKVAAYRRQQRQKQR